MKKVTRLLLIAGICAVAPKLDAQQCFGNTDLAGTYGLIAVRFVPVAFQPAGTGGIFTPVPVTPPGTSGVTTTTLPPSQTSIGTLLAAARSVNPFSTAARLLFDGTGVVFALGTTGGLRQAGTYSINADCTMTMTLQDAFATPSGNTPAASARFDGIIRNRGNEILLAQATGGTGAELRLRRMSQSGVCSNETITGAYGVYATGVGPATTTGGSGLFSLIGRINANANGLFTPLAGTPALPARQLTGTYTIASDCTGTGTLVTSDGRTRRISFLLTNSNLGTLGPRNNLDEIHFVFTDPGVIGIGEASAQ